MARRKRIADEVNEPPLDTTDLAQPEGYRHHGRRDDDGDGPRGQRTSDSHRPPRRDESDDDPVAIASERPVDGSGSNEDNSDWGATDQELLRLADADFGDGIGALAGEDRPNPREISNAVVQQSEDEPNSFGVSDLFWAWGQFIDHDLDLTESGSTESASIPVPAGDPDFDPFGTGEAIIPFFRVDPVEGTGETTPREYPNEITAFLDASMVYGSDEETAAALRDTGGKLLLTDEDFLPATDDGGVLAGDVRAGENIALTSLQTLFAREHNWWVDQLAPQDSSLTDDELYEAARQRVEGEIQAITFNEFLPLLVGEDAITAYEGYDSSVNPGISVEFSTAAFRFGHSLLSPEIQRLEESGVEIDAGNIALRAAFFSPNEISENGGIDPILRGLADGTAQELDIQLVEDVRSFLFGEPGQGGLDLASLNIQRGRDLGVASYNDLREAMGLERAQSFDDITSDAELAGKLEELYGNVDSVDAWIGGLAEDAHGDGMVGEVFSAVIVDQFLRVRDGDPYWSQGRELPGEEIEDLWSTTLSDVIERNTGIDTFQDQAFLAFDRIGGDDGDNQLDGGGLSDLLVGLDGDDQLFGWSGNDQLEGSAGRDVLSGGAGDDILRGGKGNDVLIGGGGEDDVNGGRGLDTLVLEGDLGDYSFTTSRSSFEVEDGDGNVDLVKRVEQVHFLGSGDTFVLDKGALVEVETTDDLNELLDEELVMDLLESEDAADSSPAPAVEPASDASGPPDVSSQTQDDLAVA